MSPGGSKGGTFVGLSLFFGGIVLFALGITGNGALLSPGRSLGEARRSSSRGSAGSS